MTFKIRDIYADFENRHQLARQILGRPLTLSEKIIFSHMNSLEPGNYQRGKSFLALRPDRVAMQDATAQMAILQFMQAGINSTRVPSSIHCDHLILASQGASADLETAVLTNREVYDFLQSAAAKYGMDFWKPGSGIIHQIVLENYAFPGGLLIGTDSHTPNAGGLGMMAVGVGGADAVDAMVGDSWELLYPGVIGVELKGRLQGWGSGKDIILKLLQQLSVKGGTNKIMEYFGEGVESLSCTAQATAANMGAELGATCSLFPYHSAMGQYLRMCSREDEAVLADEYIHCLRPDKEVLADPGKYYDKIIEIDLSRLGPHITGPHTPDLVRPVSGFKKEISEKSYPDEVKAALIGSCTNSSYEDMGRAAHVLNQGLEHGLTPKADLLITPGSSQVYQTIQQDGYLDIFTKAGAKVMANACGPCIGQWKRNDTPKGVSNSIVSSFNRNFPARNDGNPATLSFITSPEMTAVYALSGSLSFDPQTDTLIGSDGKHFKLDPPTARDLPPHGFKQGAAGGLISGNADNSKEIIIPPGSQRLQALEPFPKWDGSDYTNLLILAKVKGKCTTDHISPAGPWLKFRGHLDNISDNMLAGALNAFTGQNGTGTDALNEDEGVTFAKIARHYKKEGRSWAIIGDENYGEGSSREHAAMTPRHLGAKVIITRSIARIHETNLKKQGVLPLTFTNPDDYDLIGQSDTISIGGLSDISPGKVIMATIKHEDGSCRNIQLSHSFNKDQIKWFKAGGAINLIRNQA